MKVWKRILRNKFDIVRIYLFILVQDLICKYQIKERYKVFICLSLSNHCSRMNRCPCSEYWDLDIPVYFLDDWMLQLTFCVLGICHHFKTQEVLGQEQFKFVVVSEIELNVLKIKTCTVPMSSKGIFQKRNVICLDPLSPCQ